MRPKRLAALPAVAAAMLSGALYGAAFPPLGWGPLAWVALVPLFVACARSGPLRAALLGLLWAEVAGLAAAPFLPEMLTAYFRVPEPWRLPAALGLLFASAGPHAAALGVCVSVAARRESARPLLLALAFGAFELLRSRLGLQNSWALLADAQLGWGPLVQAADVAGPWGLGVLVAWANALLAAALVPSLRGASLAREWGALVLLVATASAYGAARDLTWSPAPAEPPLQVALVQGGIARAFDAEPEPGRSREDLERYLGLTERDGADADLVVWPEGAVDFPPGLLTKRWLRLRRWSRAQAAPLVFGAPRVDRGQPDVRWNSVFALERGRLRLAQDKVLLVPFAERAVAGLGARRLRAGEGPTPLESAGRRLGILVCSEIMSSAYARRMARAGAEVLVNVSNDYWFASDAGARGQLAKARMRAIETRRPVLRATSTGYSAWIDPRGQVRALGPRGPAAQVRARIEAAPGGSPYLWWGDAPAWLSLGLLAWWLRPRPRGGGASAALGNVG